MQWSEVRVGTVTGNDLHAALEQALRNYFGVDLHIILMQRRPSAYQTSCALEEVDVHLDDGRVLHLMFKDLSSNALAEKARQVKPIFLRNPLREIETYRCILSSVELGTATCYGAVVDPSQERYWLFLERVPGRELYQIGDLDAWCAAAGWLARMHSQLAMPAARMAETSHLLIYDEAFYRAWPHRAMTFALRRPGSVQPEYLQTIERLAECYDPVVEALLALPQTVIHGEFYASNVLIQETPDELRVCPVDWEMAAVAPGLMDVAALVAGGWSDSQREELALAYYSALSATSYKAKPPAEFLHALDYCRLHLALQWLGWASNWTPPPEHAQDWQADVLVLAEKLEL
jgi:hypothetical protein